MIPESNPIDGTVSIIPVILSNPILYAPQRKISLQNYRAFVQDYNNAIAQRNQEVMQYNIDVECFIAQNNVSEESARVNKELRSDLKRVSIELYNYTVKRLNDQAGKLLYAMKKYKPVRKSTEHIFSMLLFKYGEQISEKSAILTNAGATTVRALQKVKINSHELANTTINEINTLPYTKRTIQNHITRLSEAGVLFDYTFKGHQKPVEYYVNSQILAISEATNQKNTIPQNQLFNFIVEKSFHNNEIVTSTIKDKKKITEIVNNQFQLKEVFDLSLRSKNKNPHKTTGELKKPQGTMQAGPREISPENEQNGRNYDEKSLRNSEYLRSRILPVRELIMRVFNGEFDNYRFTLRKRLEHEILHGNLSKHEFRELLLQIFLMISAPIWKNKPAYLGSWFKAWQIFEDEFILTMNNQVPSKNVAFYFFDDLLARITFAKRYFRNFPDYKVLYPGEYFNPTRKTKESGGFAYTIEATAKQRDINDWRKKRKEQRHKEAIPRNKRYKAIELVNKKCNAYKNGRINLTELHDYVNNNAHIPYDIAAKLPQYLERQYQRN